MFWSSWFRLKLEIFVKFFLVITIEFEYLRIIIFLFKVIQSNKDLFVCIVHRSIYVKMDKHKGNRGYPKRPNNNEPCIQELPHVQQVEKYSYENWYVNKRRVDTRECVKRCVSK